MCPGARKIWVYNFKLHHCDLEQTCNLSEPGSSLFFPMLFLCIRSPSSLLLPNLPLGYLPFCPSVCALPQPPQAKASASQALWPLVRCTRVPLDPRSHWGEQGSILPQLAVGVNYRNSFSRRRNKLREISGGPELNHKVSATFKCFPSCDCSTFF